MAHSWMPGARRIRAGTDGGSLRGGAPRAVWLTLGTTPGAVSIQSVATRLIGEGRPCHLIWDPVTGEIAQLVSALRAGCALGGPAHATASGMARTAPSGTARGAPSLVRGATATNVNREGRLCVQVGVLGHPADPFTNGPLAGVAAIVSWLDSWNVPRRWPAGPPAEQHGTDHHGSDHHGPGAAGRGRALWALGGHFGASQVPGFPSRGPGRIDIDRITGTHVLPVYHREPRYSLFPTVLRIPA